MSRTNTNNVACPSPAHVDALNPAIVAPVSSAPATFDFKDERLNKAAAELAAVGAQLKESTVTVARVLGDIKVSKCYEKDGFKSVADFAEQIFGIKRTNAYALAKVGERFYKQNIEDLPAALSEQSPSNLAELVNLSDEQIRFGIENGAISPDSSQSQLREFAKAQKSSDDDTKKPVIVPMFRATVVFGHDLTECDDDMLEDDILPWAAKVCGIGKYDAFNLPALKSSEKGQPSLKRRVIIGNDGACGYVCYTMVKVSSKKQTRKNGPVKTYSVAELEAMLAAAKAKEEAGA